MGHAAHREVPQQNGPGRASTTSETLPWRVSLRLRDIDWESRYDPEHAVDGEGPPTQEGRDGSVPSLMVCLVPFINKDPLATLHFPHHEGVLPELRPHPCAKYGANPNCSSVQLDIIDNVPGVVTGTENISH